MNKYFVTIYRLLEDNKDCSVLIDQAEQMKMSQKEHKSFISLKLRHAIKNNMYDMMEHIISSHVLMHRDYWDCILLYNNRSNMMRANEIMTQYIDMIDTKDIDIMIKNNLNSMIAQWDGFPVECSHMSNTMDLSKLKIYDYDMKKITDIYTNKINPRFRITFDKLIQNCDILIDGANISHVKKDFDYNELVTVIRKLEEYGYIPKIILHERHVVTIPFLQKYIIQVPRNNYDDNFLLYSMLKYNKKIVSNDLFRDHVIDINEKTKCFVKCFINTMTIKYVDNMLVIPQYSRCIQIIESSIYIPCKDGFYLM